MRNYLILIILIFILPTIKAERYISVLSSNVNKQTNVSNPLPFGAPNVVHWSNSNLTWWLNSLGASGNGIDYNTTKTQISNAFDSWQNINTSAISFSYSGATNNTWAYDYCNTIYWAEEGDDIYEPEGGFINNSSILASTIIVYNSNFELLDVDIVFNGKDHSWNTTGINGIDIQAVATHEIGHMIGLHHTEISYGDLPVMYYSYKGIEQRILKLDDKVGASFLYGGNIITNKNFINPQNYFYWDVNVNSNKTLTINKNLIIKNSSKIFVNGTLNIQGTSSNKVIVDFITPNSSNGIKINPGGSADIEYAEIKNAYYGVYNNEAELEISNSIIKDCLYGLYLYRTNYTSSQIQPHITNCDIYKTSYNGSGTGIYCNYSSPIILNTNISNYYTGIGTIYNSSPLLGHYTANGNNSLHNNYKNLHAISNSNPFLGTTSYGGYNTLKNYTYKNLIAQTNCNIYAENNYWGSTNSSTIASGISIYSGCSVDYVPFITWDPNGSTKQSINSLTKSSSKDLNTNNEEIRNIQNQIQIGNLEEALTECNELLTKNKDGSTTLIVIDLMWQIERKMKENKNNTTTDVFAEIRNKEENDLSKCYVNLIDANGKNSDERISSLDNVLLKSDKIGTIEEAVLYAKILYYYNEEMNLEKAKEQYEILAKKYPDSPITKEVTYYIDGNGKNGNLDKGNNSLTENLTDIP